MIVRYAQKNVPSHDAAGGVIPLTNNPHNTIGIKMPL